MPESKTRESVLVVDDEPATVEILRRNLAAHGYRVYTANAVDEAVRLLAGTRVDLVVTDFKMPRQSGLELVRHVRENLADTEVVMITGYPTVQGAVQAVKIGAEEYVPKPFTDEELLEAVTRALDKRRRRLGSAPPERPVEPPEGMLGTSPAMTAAYAAIERAAGASITVLVTGESGTGKELAARGIHYRSARASAPFVPVHCGGIPEGLLESELFGHVKGAFTGALDNRIGFFEVAEGGTILLDEIGDTTPVMQTKLLRVLQDRAFTRVGDSRARTANVRVIAATNKDLGQLVRRGAFREDLFYRLNVLEVRLPPLRERGDDLLLLAAHFVERCAKDLGRRPPAFTDAALAALKRYYWPGNVRELENVMQRLVVMNEAALFDVPDLPEFMRFSVRDQGLNRTLEEVEAEHIRNVLASVDGNRTRAAEILAIDRKTLRAKLKPLGLE